MRVSILLLGIDQDRHTAHVKGYSVAGLDKLDYAIPFPALYGSKDVLRRDAPVICWPSCQTLKQSYRTEAYFSLMPKPLVFYDW